MKRGFSLIEIAITLVIIGLMAAAIVGGRGLLEQANKRAAIGEIDRITKAMQLFSDKYHQLPGDYNAAVTAWGADTGCPGTVFNSVPKQATCNGNGDGTIGSYNGILYSNTYEWGRAWQHLANAGMLDGKFSGVMGNVNSSQLLGTSLPKSAIAGGGYTVLFEYFSFQTANNFARPGKHVLHFGAVDSACAGGASLDNCVTWGPLLTPSDALEIDQKIDDGLPGKGRVISRPSTSTLNPGCTTTFDPNTSRYNVAAVGTAAATTPACALIIDMGY